MMQRPVPDTIPLTPGVYVYKDAMGRILYVGKARVLRRRVLSYFREDIPAKTAAMLRRATQIETLSTTTEKEALLLEASLIKKHRPHYNIVLRDDKQYVLFRIDIKKSYPRLEIVRTARKDGARYFGPYTSALAARETWKILHKVFPLRRCTDRAMRNRVRPCLYHHMGQCAAPCMDLITPQAYAEAVRNVMDVLAGRSTEVISTLEKAMLAASDGLDFERAAALRDRMRALRQTVERQAAVLPGGGDSDVLGLHVADNGLALGVLFVRGGMLLDGRTFFWPGLTFEDAPELLLSFPSQFYGAITPPARIIMPWLPPAEKESDADADTCTPEGEDAAAPDCASGTVSPATAPATGIFPTSSAADIPAGTPIAGTPAADTSADTPAAGISAVSSVTTDAESPLAVLEQTLGDVRGGPVRFVVPRTPEENGLVDMAAANAREECRRRTETPLEEQLARALRVDAPVRRIECVDVSHTSGKQTRVGLVVFEDGKPLRSAYREYAMPDGDGDDYGTLAAWVARRLESGPPWPDVLLIDGGKGQLGAVQRALREAGQEGLFALASIAKARDEQGHADRRAGNVADRIFLPERSNPLPLREGCPELLFLQHVRDCTHNFAIGRHRRARTGAALSGELLRLPGIGPHMARLLWEHFGTVEKMAQASVQDLQSVPGVGVKKAQLLHRTLQKLASTTG